MTILDFHGRYEFHPAEACVASFKCLAVRFDPEQQCLNYVLCPNIHCSLPTWSGGRVSVHEISHLCSPAPESSLCIGDLRPGAACVKLLQTPQYRINTKMQEHDRRARCLAFSPISCALTRPWLLARSSG